VPRGGEEEKQVWRRAESSSTLSSALKERTFFLQRLKTSSLPPPLPRRKIPRLLSRLLPRLLALSVLIDHLGIESAKKE
jgi:hypothetical protein